MSNKLYIKEKFSVLPNDLINNPNISLKAKGLYAYLQSKPDGWQFSILRIAKQTKEGKTAIEYALKELENYGYLERKPTRDSNGKWAGCDYILHASPVKQEFIQIEGKPHTDFPYPEKPPTENLVSKEKKNIEKNKNNNTTTTTISNDIVMKKTQSTQNVVVTNNLNYSKENDKYTIKEILNLIRGTPLEDSITEKVIEKAIKNYQKENHKEYREEKPENGIKRILSWMLRIKTPIVNPAGFLIDMAKNGMDTPSDVKQEQEFQQRLTSFIEKKNKAGNNVIKTEDIISKEEISSFIQDVLNTKINNLKGGNNGNRN